jgi:hypothetical protein
MDGPGSIDRGRLDLSAAEIHPDTIACGHFQFFREGSAFAPRITNC